MNKINFTQEHMQKLQMLALQMLMTNQSIENALTNCPIDITELLHRTSIKNLQEINNKLGKKIEKEESTDEWIATIDNQLRLEQLKAQKELVHLIIGYKRYVSQENEIAAQKLALQKEITQLREDQKTPADRIKEKEEALAALSNSF